MLLGRRCFLLTNKYDVSESPASTLTIDGINQEEVAKSVLTSI